MNFEKPEKKNHISKLKSAQSDREGERFENAKHKGGHTISPLYIKKKTHKQ